MNTELQKSPSLADHRKAMSEMRVSLTERAKEIDAAGAVAMKLYDGGTSLADTLAIAQAMVDLRALITPEVMRPIMALMNTQVGFATDRDPTKQDYKTGKYPEPYDEATVKDVLIISLFHGFRMIGNETNIIAGKFYGAQNGFTRRARELTQFTYEPWFEAPRISADGKTALIKCGAAWKKPEAGKIGGEGDPCELSIRINAMMGADGAIGKAQRKLAKRVVERLTGREVPEIGDEAPATEVSATVTRTAPKLPDDPEPVKETIKPVDPAPAPEVKSPAFTLMPDALTGIHAQFADEMASQGISIDVLRGVLGDSYDVKDADSITFFAQVPGTLIAGFLKGPKSMATLVKLCKEAK